MKLVVFDIDGTLLDNLAAEDECFVQALRDGLGLNAVSPEWETYQHVSDHGIAIETYRREFGAAPLPDAVADTIGRFVALLAAAYHSQPISPIPGAGELLASLPSHGWAIAMATGAWRRAAHFKLTAAGLRDDAIPLATSEDGPARTDIVKAAVARAERHYDASTVSSRWATACGTWMPPEHSRSRLWESRLVRAPSAFVPRGRRVCCPISRAASPYWRRSRWQRFPRHHRAR